MGFAFCGIYFTDVGNQTQWGIEGLPLRMDVVSGTFKCYSCKNGSFYTYVDKGEDYFGESFVHQIDFKVQSNEWGLGYIWMLANDLGDVRTLSDAHKTFMGIKIITTPDGPTMQLFQWWYDAELGEVETVGGEFLLTEGQMYYLTITRISSDAKLYYELYSDPSRTEEYLICSTYIGLSGNYSYRYLYIGNTWYVDPNENFIMQLHSENLNIDVV